MKYLEANEIVFRHIDRDGVDFDGLIEDIRAAVAEALSLAEQDRTMAVAAEREACWKIANEFAQQLMSSPIFTTGSAKMAMAEEIAAAIRARGGGETSNTD